MPTYRGINVELRCPQHDILIIPEYPPPQEGHRSSRGLTESSSSDTSRRAPQLVDHAASLVTVYIPIFPSSQFWLCYSVDPSKTLAPYYYFKLYVSGEHVVSWGCGRADGYRGKTMYALYDRGNNLSGNESTEKRCFAFSSEEQLRTGNQMRFLEIRVYRSNGRKRIQECTEKFEKSEVGRVDGDGVGYVPRSRLLVKLHGADCLE